MSHAIKQLDRENLNSHKNKPILQPPKLQNGNRLAFGEVGNKIPVNQVQNGAKPKLPSDGIKKPLATTKKLVSEATNNKKTSKTVTKPEVVHKKHEKKVLVKQQPAKLPNFVSYEVSDSYSTKQLLEVINIDTSDNPLHVSEYVQDIYKYLLELENRFAIEQNFLEGHKTTPRMRAVLVNWMVGVHINFKLLLETLHLSVAIVDRYLNLNKEVGKETLQLVGTTAMWIAGKYEDLYIPELADFVYICDNAYPAKQFTEMECEILRKLDFNMGRPLSLQFLRRFSRIAGVNADQHALAKYLLELGLLDYELCYIKPSLQAAAACCLAISILDEVVEPCQKWSNSLVHYSSYSYKDIKPVVMLLACALKKTETSKYTAIYNKYSNANYSKISMNPKLKGPLVQRLVAQSSIVNKK